MFARISWILWRGRRHADSALSITVAGRGDRSAARRHGRFASRRQPQSAAGRDGARIVSRSSSDTAPFKNKLLLAAQVLPRLRALGDPLCHDGF